MSDFIARVTAEFDKSSLSSLQSTLESAKLTAKISNFKLDTSGLPNQIQGSLDKHKFTIHLDGLKMDSITKQSGTLGNSISQNIMKAIDTRKIESQISGISNSFNNIFSKATVSGDTGMVQKLSQTKTEVDNLSTSYMNLKFAMTKAVTSGSQEDMDNALRQYLSLNSTVERLGNTMKIYGNTVNQTSAAQTTLTKSATLSNNMEAWLNKNNKAAMVYRNTIVELQNQLKNNSNPAVLKSVSESFTRIQSEAKAAGLTVTSFATSFGKLVLQATGLGSSLMVMQKALTLIKQGISTVVGLDTALIDLQKTSTATAEQLNDFYYEANESAKELGVTTQTMIQNAADFSRLGFNLEDSKTMAKVAAMFEAISPGMTQQQAIDGLVSTIKAFGIEASDSLDGVASKINAIGNSRAVDNTMLVEMLTRSSAAMAEANNSLDETIALGTAAIEITRDAASVGTALRTISMRIRGYDEETEEYIGGVEQLSGDIADLTKTASAPGGISLFTDDAKTEYKSTIQILRDISEVYDELTDKQQAALLEKLGGKRGGQIIAAILSNFDAVEESLDTMENSAGNAEQEMSIITQSLEYRLNALKETGTGIWQNLFKREDMGVVIDMLTTFANAIDTITEKLGLFGTVLAGGGIAALAVTIKRIVSVVNSLKLDPTIGAVTFSNVLQGVFPRLQSAISGVVTAWQSGSSLMNSATAAVGAGFQGLWGIIQAHPIIAAVTAITALVGALKYMSEAGERANQKMRDSVEAYNSSQSQIENVNNELLTTQTRIDELNAKESITLVEQAELDKLYETNEQLLIEIDSLKQAAAISAQESVDNAVKAYHKNVKGGATEEEVQADTDYFQGWFDTGQQSPFTLADDLLAGMYDNEPSKLLAAVDLLEQERDYFEEGTAEWTRLNDAISQIGDNIFKSEDGLIFKLEEYYDTLGQFPDQLSDADKQIYNEIGNTIEALYQKFRPNDWKQIQLDSIFAKSDYATLKDELVQLAKDMGGLDEVTISGDKFQPLVAACEEAGISVETLLAEINKLAGVEVYDASFMRGELQKVFDVPDLRMPLSPRSEASILALQGASYYSPESAGFASDDFFSPSPYAGSFDRRQLIKDASEVQDYIDTLSDEEIEIIYKYSLENDISSMSVEDLQALLKQTTTVAEDLGAALSQSAESTSALIGNISNIQEVLAGQSTGNTLSYENYSSAELQDFATALEFVNGTYRYNADAVDEIIKLKAREQKAIIATNKANDQAQYMEQCREIDRLCDKIASNNYAMGESRESLFAEVAALQDSNTQLKQNCIAYDMMTVSINNATDAYHDWLNAQNASEAGDMFGSALDAINLIDDTLNDSTYENYNKTNRVDYKSAVDFVIPDTVDAEDSAAVNAYLQSIAGLFYSDDNGKVELNVAEFCRQATQAGLMEFSDSTGEYQIAGEQTIESFAEGMGLAVPLVQAMFGELEEYGFTFNWAQEGAKTIGDLGVEAYDAAAALRAITGEDLKIVMDVSEFEDTALAISTLDSTIEQMDSYKATLKADSSEYQYANSIIAYCVAQKQQLEAPVIMSVDTSQVTGELGNALALLQQFQQAQYDKQIALATGADTSSADATISALCTEIEGLSPEIKAKLGIEGADEASLTASIQAAISGMTESTLVTLGVDSSLVDTYLASEHDSTGIVHYSADTAIPDAYEKRSHSISATITWNAHHAVADAYESSNHDINAHIYYTPVTVGAPLISNGFTGVGGVTGTAMVGGNWAAEHGGKTLVGELGREIIVNPHSGKWYTVGDNGPEFINLPRGAIVFNHLQTEDLLRDGNTIGRAAALASGTAKAFSSSVSGGGSATQKKKPDYYYNGGASKQTGVSGGGKVPQQGQYTGGSGGSSGSSSGKSGGGSSSSKSKEDKEEEEEPEFIDWIEIAIDRLQRAIDQLDIVASSSFKSLADRTNAIYDEMEQITAEIELQQQAAARYQKQADSVGLDEKLAKQVREGKVDIKEYDEETQKLIQDYQEWYEKSLDCSDAIAELEENLSQLYADNFSNIKDKFEGDLSLLEHLTNTYNNGIDALEAKGYLESKVYYEALSDVEKSNIGVLQDELDSLMESYSEAMASGAIAEGSQEWYEMNQAINETKEKIQESEIALDEYIKKMRELDWSYFDLQQTLTNDLSDEADFLIDLLDNEDMYDDKGQINERGASAMGLHGMNYNIYMNQADQYNAERQKIAEQLGEDPYNQDLLNRRRELNRLQQESILNAEKEKEAIIDMVRDGIELELDALQDLISARKDALDSAVDLYEYQNKIREHTDEISSLEKQLSAYTTGNDTSEENKATVQKLQTQLEEARQDLEETEYDKYVADQKALLDELYTEYEAVLNSRFDNIDALLADMITSINLNASAINDELWNVGLEVGYTLSSGMATTWAAATTAIDDALKENGGSIEGLLQNGTFLLDSTKEQILQQNYLTGEQAQKLREEGLSVMKETIGQYSPLGDAYETSAFGTTMTSINSTLGTNGVNLSDLAVWTSPKSAVYFGKFDSLLHAVSTGMGNLAGAWQKDWGSLDSAVKALQEERATPKDYVDKAKENSDKTAEKTVDDKKKDVGDTGANTPNTPAKETPQSPSKKQPSTQKKPATEKQSSTKPKAPELKKGAVVELKPNTKWYYSSTGSNPIGYADSWLKGHKAVISHINNASWATHPYSITVDGDGVTGGWVRKKDIVGYASGGLVKQTGPAWLDGTPQSPEIVLSAADSQNFIALKDALASAVDRGVGFAPNVQDISSMSSGISKQSNVANNVSVGDTSIQIDIDHVEDYNDLINQMVKDKKFERFIQSMTIDRVVGGSSLAKNKYKW